MTIKNDEVKNRRNILVFGIQILENKFRVFIESDRYSTYYFKKTSIMECLFSPNSQIWLDFVSDDIAREIFRKHPVFQKIYSYENNIFHGDIQNLSFEKVECFYYKELILDDFVKTVDLFSFVLLLLEELDNAIKNPNHKMSKLLNHL